MLRGREGNSTTNIKLLGEYFSRAWTEAAADPLWLEGIAMSDTLFWMFCIDKNVRKMKS